MWAKMPIGQWQGEIAVETRGRGFADISGQLAVALRDAGAGDGLLTVFLRHTSASLTVQENADPDVLHDLAAALDRLAPENAPYRHVIEGADDMPAHIKGMLTGVSLTLPVESGRLVLGTWQGVYLIEHRRRPHRRSLSLVFQGTERR